MQVEVPPSPLSLPSGGAGSDSVLRTTAKAIRTRVPEWASVRQVLSRSTVVDGPVPSGVERRIVQEQA
jgi:hypothetical protein